MSEGAPRLDGSNCFVCGPRNPIGLQLKFRLDEDICRSEFTPAEVHCGFDGVTHGGILFSALDDVMANWLYLKGIRGYTAKCEMRFRSQLPTGCTVRLTGECIKQRRQLVVMRGTAHRVDTDELVAECEASFMSEGPLEQAAR